MTDLGIWADKTLGTLGDDVVPELSPLESETDGMPRIDKRSVTYLHVMPSGVTQYECRDCPMWISDTERCTIHGEDVIRATGSCNFFVHGPPITSAEDEPHGMVTTMQSGYEENPYGVGFSCKRCTFFVPHPDGGESGGCDIVDYDSSGDDPGMIHPNACCNAWVIDEERGSMSTV